MSTWTLFKMNEYENYVNNIDITDTYGLSGIIVDKNVSYRGNINAIKKAKTEDENSHQPLAAAFVGLNNTAAPLPTNSEFYNAWTDSDTLEFYLNSKPTCYLILSKPGAGAYSLGEAMSKKLNCIHFCPKNIIMDEIDQKSSTGMCLQFNMKQNKVCSVDKILKMLKVKLKSPAVAHRGYIISGFPLVTSNKSEKYMFNSLYGEEAIMIVDELLYDITSNLRKKKPKTPKKDTDSSHSSIASTVDLGEEEHVEEEPELEELPEEEEEELKVELPKFVLNTCTDIIIPMKPYYNAKKAVLLEQLKDLFDLEIKPDIIIYLSCPDKDLVTYKSHKFINYKTNHNIVEPFSAKPALEDRWPVKYTTSDYLSPFDSHTFNPKYSCRQPSNFEKQSVAQMCNYRNNLLPLIESKLKDFDPKYVIKVDARLTLHEIMHNVFERLNMLPIMPIIIPEPLFMDEPPEDKEEFWTLIQDQNVIHADGVTFNRRASFWYNRCPVELKQRLSVEGNPKLAVTFSKYVFLMASLNNMISFSRNPRPYLKLKYLEPTCRIIVMGTKFSGKSMISECLSWLFDTPIINYNNFLQSQRKIKYDSYSKTILSEIIATIEDTRLAKWQTEELERFAKVDEWCKAIITKLKQYIPVLEEYITFTKNLKDRENARKIKEKEKKALEEDGLSEEELVADKSIEEGSARDRLVKKTIVHEDFVEEEEVPVFTSLDIYNELRKQLSSLPILDDIGECKNAVFNNLIAQYAPIELQTPKEKPALPVLGDDDVKQSIDAYIIANDLGNEIEPSVEEIMNEIVNVISSIDIECQKDTNSDSIYGKYIIDGFPSDPQYWNILAEAKLFPDYTVALIENREIEPELIEQYKEIEHSIKNHHARYELANDPLIKIKLKTKKVPDYKDVDVNIIMKDFVKNILDAIGELEETQENSETIIPDLWISFPEQIDKFKEDWVSVKQKIEEFGKVAIDVELEHKTDIQVVDEVLLKLRKGYSIPCIVSEDEVAEELEDEDETPKDITTYNNPQNFGETGVFCPISYYNYGVLWEGNPELCIKFDGKIHRFSKDECLELFKNDVTKYQSYNKPFKALPPIRVCVIGCIGTGKSTIAKLLAKELGLTHIDFADIINDFLIPKHFKKVGRRYENPFLDKTGDEEGAVEFQTGEENVISDILSNETELRRMVFNYFEVGTPLLPPLMQKLITKVWFESPFLNTGFILDGYPRLPTDVEDMMACYCIPDLVIEIEGSAENSLRRLSAKMFKTWKMQLIEAKEKSRQKHENEKKEWMDFLTKNIVAKLIVDDILDTIGATEPIKGWSNDSVVIDVQPIGSVIDANLHNAYNEMVVEFPEPVEQIEWEKPDEVHERIESRIESIYETDDENIQLLKDVLSEQRIRITTIDGNKSLNKVSRVALSKVTTLRKRNESFFEQTYVINTDIAELLLLEGFCFLSKFNRMCPVYIFENKHAIQNIYNISKLRSHVFPVIHRSYVYFICGTDSVWKFRINPLKYVTSDNICHYKEYPLRIGVIGAPKSGKSSLCAKLAKRYGLISLSKGIAVRHVLHNKNWTELANKMLSSITSGDCINSDLVMKAVHIITMDHRTISNGFVLDGIPETASEAMELVKVGLFPNIIFDISADKETVKERSQTEIYHDLLKRNPPYSRSFIENRFYKWKENKYKVREWVDRDYQNIYILEGNKSKWRSLQDAVTIISYFIPKVHYYLTNVEKDIVPAHAMCISNDTFENRMSNFKNMCPVCLRNNIYMHNIYSVDKKGVVQYKNKFYWICSDHMEMVLKYPQHYLTLQKVDIPELPAIVKTVDMSLVYENGICIVTYAEHLPAQKLTIGTNKYAASFRNYTYLFCSKTCLKKFLAKPHLYFDISVFKQNKFPPLSLKNLPDIGYLEQTIGTILTEACCSLNALRPKYPGLSFQMSGLLHVALYLKTNNPRMDTQTLRMYIKISEIYAARCKLLMRVALLLRSMDNPFAKYPKCCTEKQKKTICKTETITKPSTMSKHSASLSEITDILRHRM